MQRWLPVVMLTLAMAACGTSKPEKQMQETMDAWSTLMRWNQFDSLVDFMHPEWLEENPVTPLDVDRLHQFRVTGYRVRQVVAREDGLAVDRVVELHTYHVHTAHARTVQFMEAWRWDPERERWMLHSGLPDLSGR